MVRMCILLSYPGVTTGHCFTCNRTYIYINTYRYVVRATLVWSLLIVLKVFVFVERTFAAVCIVVSYWNICFQGPVATCFNQVNFDFYNHFKYSDVRVTLNSQPNCYCVVLRNRVLLNYSWLYKFNRVSVYPMLILYSKVCCAKHIIVTCFAFY